VTKVKGAYAVLRLYCEVPELKGKEIDTLADLLENGKEGVDIVTLLPANVAGFAQKIPEIWEIKHVSDAGRALTDAQIRKHIRTKVADYYDRLARGGATREGIPAIMSQVKLRFEVIAPNAINGTKDAIFKQVEAILKVEFPQLGRTGFRFSLSDVFVRAGNPLVTPLAVLPGSF